MRKSEYYKLIESIYYTDQNILLARSFYESVRMRFHRKVRLAYEIGCGYGVAASFFKEMAIHLVLMDTDPNALEYVKHKIGDNCSITTSSSIIQSPDLIYFFMSLHHIEKFHEEVDNAISHIIEHNAMVAICEMEPDSSTIFHRNEVCPHDGLKKCEFNWIKRKYPSIEVLYTDLPSIEAYNTTFNCYCLILMSTKES